MTPAVWIALASFGVVVLAHVIAGAYFFGAQNQRLKAIESRPPDDCAVQLAAMTATLVAMEKRLDSMEAGIAARLSNLETRLDAAIKHSAPAPRRRAA